MNCIYKNTLTRLVLSLVLFLPSISFAASFQGKVVKVSDGDTIQVMHQGKAEKVRLAEIDCPERDQPYGKAAKRYVLDVAAHEVVTIEVETTDHYGRTVGQVILPSGKNLKRELVREGYAWWYRRYSDDASLGRLEKQARNAERGLWEDPSPVPPWEWRRGQRQASNAQATAKDFTCGSKQYCKEMTSCAEAKFYLRECGLSRLDGDGDGVPCEMLCR